MHGGFTQRICDFSWNLHERWCILAAAEDNQLQIFRPTKSVWAGKKEVPLNEIEE